MRIVMIESPYTIGAFDRDACVRYAQFCLRDSLARGECPFASHLFYTHVLPEDREGRALGLACRDAIALATGALVARYVDIGTTPGMFRDVDIDRHATTEARGLPPQVLERFLAGDRIVGSLMLKVVS